MHILKFILQMAKPYKRHIAGVAFAISCVALDMNLKPYLIKTIIDNVSQNYYNNIWIIIGIYALSQFALVWAWSFFDLCEFKFAPQLTSHITKSFTEQISKYPYRFFQENLSGSITAKITDAARRVPRVINTFFVEFFKTFILTIITVILLATVHYIFAIAIVVWIATFISIMYFGLQKASTLSSIEAEADSKTGGILVDYFSNIFAARIFTTSKYERQRLENHLDDYITKSRAKGMYLRSYFIVQGCIFALYIIGCLCGMIYWAYFGLITPGEFALVFMLNFEIVGSLFHLTMTMNDFVSNCGAIGQALTILNTNPEIQDNIDAKQLQIQQAKITFENVHFNYHGTQEALFKDKSINIAPGSKVGLVGYSGGGKTTFVNLIMRIYDITSGRILIDDQDIRKVTQDSLRSAIGMIPQDPTLFHRTLMENIHYGRLDATEAEVIIAAKKAHAHEFIFKLPEGYESLVGERGVKLSGGQRQRIAIARAILKNAPILILDEATSQLDSVTEQLIQDSLWNLMQDKTTIVIAHRLSTLLRMDRILVFEQGKIVEDGTHQELVVRNGLYKTLWDAQVGGFLPDSQKI